jgi:hypothetical protein
MLSAQDVLVHYRALLRERELPENLLANRFPPFLCSRLITGEDFELDRQSSSTGLSCPSSFQYAANGKKIDILWGSDVSAITDGLPLAGHLGLVKNAEHYIDATTKAIDFLVQPPFVAFFNTMMEWTSQIVWLDVDANSTYTRLTSSTFPSFPHCTFLTGKATYHIPPLTVSSQEYTYFLAENLYHESLHQKLSCSFIFDNIIVDDFDSTTIGRIPVPWRGQSWEPDRIVHAAFVYIHLVLLRSAALTLDLNCRDQISSALAAGRDALTYLVSCFPACEPIFTHRGRLMLENFRLMADQVLTRDLMSNLEGPRTVPF